MKVLGWNTYLVVNLRLLVQKGQRAGTHESALRGCPPRAMSRAMRWVRKTAQARALARALGRVPKRELARVLTRTLSRRGREITCSLSSQYVHESIERTPNSSLARSLPSMKSRTAPAACGRVPLLKDEASETCGLAQGGEVYSPYMIGLGEGVVPVRLESS